MTLAAAIAANDIDAVRASLKGDGKSELNAPTEGGEVLLHRAIKAKNLQVARALLEAGANVNQPSDERGTTKGYTAAHFAARAGDVDALALLAEFKADLNRQAADGWAPVHTACFSGKSAATRRIIELGGDVNVTNEHGMTPLVFAANHGRVGDVRFLIKNGGDVNFTDVNGDSLLHHALHFRLQEMFEGEYDMPECQFDVAVCLAVSGAPVNKPNGSGKTALEWIVDGEMGAFVDVLKILRHNSAALVKAGAADLNYVSLLSAQPQVFMALGLSAAHAADLDAAVKKFDAQRLAEKKRKEEERPSGGCPVMKGGRKKKGAAAAAAAGTTPEGHPPMDMAAVPADGSDPSGGQCPFFQKKAKQEANSAGDASRAAPEVEEAALVKSKAAAATAAPIPAVAATKSVDAPVTAVTNSGAPPALNWQFLYENRVVILLMLVSFFCGSYVEQKFGAASQGYSTRRAL